MRRIAVLTSGGDAPGMNAAIRAIVRAGIQAGLEVYAINNGYQGLYENSFELYNRKSVANIVTLGGTVLGSSRFPQLKEEATVETCYNNLKAKNIDLLIVIGGEGSYKGAEAINKFGQKVITIPGTIDNDIASTGFSIGFDTAVNTAVDAIDKVRDTSSSHHRCSLVEVMGRHCGDIAIHAGLAEGAEYIITPEGGLNFDDLCDTLRLAQENKKTNAIIIVSENTCDLRELATKIEQCTSFKTSTTILGYIQRGGKPSAYDRFIAATLGAYAINCYLKGDYNIALGIEGRKVYHTDLTKANKMKKKPLKLYYDIANELK